MLALAFVLAALQQPTAPPLRSPIARVDVQPAEAAIQVGQSIRLSATAYDSAGRVVDVSGELRGDLLAQGREIAHVVTGDQRGAVPNAANTWGVIYRDGLIYANDINSGL